MSAGTTLQQLHQERGKTINTKKELSGTKKLSSGRLVVFCQQGWG